MTLSIDIETYSSYDLKKCGVYKYVEADDFEILLFAYQYTGQTTQIVDLTCEVIPDQVLQDITDPAILKKAFNANFERTCIAAYFNIVCDPKQWECTMVRAAMVGLPMSLDEVAKALKLSIAKDTAGTSLINYFSKPCKPSKANGQRTRNLPEHAPEKWQSFKDYCVKDVDVECAVSENLSWFKIPDFERRLWILDQQINDRGVLVDKGLAAAAVALFADRKKKLIGEAAAITGLSNPNSVQQVIEWLNKTTDEEVTSLTKETVPELLKNANGPEVIRVLEIRQELSKTSVKKYTAIMEMICKDGRVRGLLQFYGAARTGRWSGRKIQMQNLRKNSDRTFGDGMANIAEARELVRAQEPDALEFLFGAIPDVLSQLIRTAFLSDYDHLKVSDFSAIEARVIAWLANEKWRLDVFKGDGRIYEASAASMFKVPLETIVKGHPNYALRAKGKVGELACGYQGGVNALIAMGALKMGLTEEELPDIVTRWRRESPNIVKLWKDVERAAKMAIEGRPTQIQHGIKFKYIRGCLVIVLPSGRPLFYQNARLVDDQYGKKIVYDGVDQKTRRWGRQSTYGGKIVENCTQAIARDCLAVSMLRLDDAGYKIVMCVHDENIEDSDVGSIEEMNTIMGSPIDWAPGLPLAAAGYITKFYLKED